MRRNCCRMQETTAGKHTLRYVTSRQHTVSGHHRPASETPFTWRFASRPIVAHFKTFIEQSRTTIDHTSETPFDFVCLFDLILYVPVNNLQLCRDEELGWTSIIKQKLMCLAQEHNASSNPKPRGFESVTLPLSHCAPWNAICMIWPAFICLPGIYSIRSPCTHSRETWRYLI